MPYKIRASKKKQQAMIPVQELKGKVALLKERFSSRPLLTGGVIATVAVILISIPTYLLFMRQSEDRAWGLEQQASRLFHEKPALSEADKKDATKSETSLERLTKASILYDDILDRYPTSKAAVIAQFEAGNVYAELDNYALAEKRYLAFLKKETERKELLPLVHLRLAYLYQKQKKDALALDHFKTAYEWEGGFSKDQAGFERGSLLERIGKKQEAIEIYNKVSSTFTDSPWGTEAKARLAMLNSSDGKLIATSTLPAAIASGVTPPAMPSPVSAPTVAAPIPAKFRSPSLVSTPSPSKGGTSPAGVTKPAVVQKMVPPTAPTPTASSPVIPEPVLVEVPSAAVGVPTVPSVPSVAPAPPSAPSTAIPLEITMDQLRLLREKGSLTIPLSPQPPQAPVPAKVEPIVPLEKSEPKKEVAPSGAEEAKPE